MGGFLGLGQEAALEDIGCPRVGIGTSIVKYQMLHHREEGLSQMGGSCDSFMGRVGLGVGGWGVAVCGCTVLFCQLQWLGCSLFHHRGDKGKPVNCLHVASI